MPSSEVAVDLRATVPFFIHHPTHPTYWTHSLEGEATGAPAGLTHFLVPKLHLGTPLSAQFHCSFAFSHPEQKLPTRAGGPGAVRTVPSSEVAVDLRATVPFFIHHPTHPTYWTHSLEGEATGAPAGLTHFLVPKLHLGTPLSAQFHCSFAFSHPEQKLPTRAGGPGAVRAVPSSEVAVDLRATVPFFIHHPPHPTYWTHSLEGERQACLPA